MSRPKLKTKHQSENNQVNKNKPVQILDPVASKIVDDTRAKGNYLIHTLSNTALSIANDDNAAGKIAVLERLWAMQKEAEDRQAEREFGISKVALAMELPPIPKAHKIEYIDKNGQKRETPYADRADIEGVLDPICRKHGFSKEYTTETLDGKSCQVLTVRHVSGHKEVYRSPYMTLDTTGSKNNNQAAGSTSEYGKRYALIGAFNIIGADVDDDGNLGNNTKDHSVDKFSEKVKEQSVSIFHAPVNETVKQELTIEEKGELLKKMIVEAPNKDKRGKILMANIKLLTALEEKELFELVESIRTEAERE